MRADHDVGLKALVDVEELLAQVVRELLVHLDGKGDVLLRLLHHAEGLAEAVRMTGEKLKVHFPYKEGDVNELPDEISFGTETERENR